MLISNDANREATNPVDVPQDKSSTPPSSADITLKHLDRAIDRLHQLIEVVETKLTPVLLPPNPKTLTTMELGPNAPMQPHPYPPLFGRFDHLTNSLDELIDRLGSILHRVDL